MAASIFAKNVRGVPPEQCALRPVEHLNPLNVVELDVPGVEAGLVDAVHTERHNRLLARPQAARADAADRRLGRKMEWVKLRPGVTWLNS
jgi:hypothetical protein